MQTRISPDKEFKNQADAGFEGHRDFSEHILAKTIIDKGYYERAGFRQEIKMSYLPKTPDLPHKFEIKLMCDRGVGSFRCADREKLLDTILQLSLIYAKMEKEERRDWDNPTISLCDFVSTQLSKKIRITIQEKFSVM